LSPTRRSIQLLFDELAWRLIDPLRQYWNLAARFRVWWAKREVTTFSQNQVDLRRQVRASGGAHFGDILDVMIDGVENGSLSERSVRDNMLTILFAGHDTTAHTMSFALYEVARHPEVEAKLLAEQHAVLGERAQVEYEDLFQLVYLQQVIDETLRLYPIGVGTSRAVHRGTRLGGYTVQRDGSWMVVHKALHTHPDFWEQPLRFHPERFSAQQRKHHHPYQYMPFASGPHACMGKNLALMEARYLLTVMLRRFHFDVLPHHPYRVVDDLTMKEAGGMPLLITARA
jgi:enediyne biosynthesis protein E7